MVDLDKKTNSILQPKCIIHIVTYTFKLFFRSLVYCLESRQTKCPFVESETEICKLYRDTNV